MDFDKRGGWKNKMDFDKEREWRGEFFFVEGGFFQNWLAWTPRLLEK